MAGDSALPDDKIAFLLITGLCSGMSMITCGFVIITMGISFNLRSDRNRQQFLALVSFCAAVLGSVGNGLQESRHSKSVGTKIVSFFFNWFVQLGFAGIAHTSIIRLLTAYLRSPAAATLNRATLACCILYLFSLPAMTPTFITLIHPSNTSVKAVARNMNIAFVCTIELLAVTSDVLLIRRFTKHKENSERVRTQMLKSMWMVYVCVWMSIGADIAAKIYRNASNVSVPDLAITNLTLTLRCMAALMYGTTFHSTHETPSVRTSGSLVDPATRPDQPKHFVLGGTHSAIKLLDLERKQ